MMNLQRELHAQATRRVYNAMIMSIQSYITITVLLYGVIFILVSY